MLTTSDLSILIHGVIPLPGTTSCDKWLSYFRRPQFLDGMDSGQEFKKLFWLS